MSRKSSISEKPIGQYPRRLADWLNLEGIKKVHSLVDKVYKIFDDANFGYWKGKI